MALLKEATKIISKLKFFIKFGGSKFISFVPSYSVQKSAFTIEHEPSKPTTRINGAFIDCTNWRSFASDSEKKKEEKLEKAKKEEEFCRTLCIEKIEQEARGDPDYQRYIGGDIYSTCGSAYVLQKKRHVCEPPSKPPPKSAEKAILEDIETSIERKNWKDPLPPFESVGQRLIELCEKKLHPSYKKYMSVEIKPTRFGPEVVPYKSKSLSKKDKIHPPFTLKISKQALDKKNIYYEFKKLIPPKDALKKLAQFGVDQEVFLKKQ